MSADGGGKGGASSSSGHGWSKTIDMDDTCSLWTRTLSYTHHWAGVRLFSGPASSLHHLAQLLYIQETSSKSTHPPLPPTITIAGFMNLSHVSPFCKDYHYTTVYTLIPENISSSSASTSSSTGASSNTSNNINTSVPCTRVLVSLQCHPGAPSLYQSFILSSIKTGEDLT